MEQNPGKVITKYNFSPLLNEAWNKTMTPKVISAGFKRVGIYPFNPNVIDYCVSTSSKESAILTNATSCQPPAASSEESMVLTDATSSQHPAVSSEESMVLTDAISSQHPAVSSEDILGPADAITSQLPANFSLEKEQLFRKRFEEKYDLPDPAYQQWLRINHPATLSLEDQPNEVNSFAKERTGYSSEQEFEDYDLMDPADQP